MSEYYIIKDFNSGEFYWCYRIDEGFQHLDGEIYDEAFLFGSKQEALDKMNDEYSSRFFEDRVLEIIEIIVPQS